MTGPGHPQKTKHHGLVPSSQATETYLKYAASINIHNHVWTSSSALENVWKTLNPDKRQLAGILGFCLINAFLAMQQFQNQNWSITNSKSVHQIYSLPLRATVCVKQEN